MICIDACIRNFQMTMCADVSGDYSEPEHRMAMQYVAQMGGAVSTKGQVVGLLAAHRTDG
jgi:isochorismate hydrolase